MVCDICKKAGARVRLAGGLVYTLCPEHQNDWHFYVLNTREYKELQEVEYKISRWIESGQADIRQLVSERIYLQNTLCNKAVKWIRDREISEKEYEKINEDIPL
jgi:hypothetical protein